jgi:hypothetical protein
MAWESRIWAEICLILRGQAEVEVRAEAESIPEEGVSGFYGTHIEANGLES